MLSVIDAKKIGIDSCIDALGREFCEEHQSNALSGYEEPINDIMRCFVTVSDKISQEETHIIGGEQMPYQAFVDVNMKTGETVLIKVVTP